MLKLPERDGGFAGSPNLWPGGHLNRESLVVAAYKDEFLIHNRTCGTREPQLILTGCDTMKLEPAVGFKVRADGTGMLG
jgi:hypothetical protein